MRIADWKIWLRLSAAIWFVLVVVWTVVILWATQVSRDTAIRQAQDFAHSIHEMTMAGLTGMMITGTVGQREVFLDQIKQLSIIRELHVARGEAVIKAFGPDSKAGRELDAVENQVMATGTPHVSLQREGANISDVARDLGFCDQSALTHHFHRHMGAALRFAAFAGGLLRRAQPLSAGKSPPRNQIRQRELHRLA